MIKRTKLLKKSPSILFLFLLLPFFVSWQSYASTAVQLQESERTLEQLGTAIHSSLAALKARSQSLTEELNEQHLIVEEYKTKLSALTTSLDNTNKRLYDYETKLIIYEQKLKRQKMWLRVGAFFVVAFIIIRVATLILRIKGIRLPEIVNILL